LIALLKQNILVNDFPNVIFQKQKTIEDVELNNKQLQNDNKQLQEQIDGYTEQDLSLIESQARFKYGLIKDGEVFYQVNTTVETENVAESSESTL
jgi:cell division protein FtsB